MRVLRAPAGVLTRPLELTVRLVLASVLVISALPWLERPLLEALLPILRQEIGAIAPEFTVLSADIVRGRQFEMLRFRAYVSRPIRIGDQLLQPFDPGGHIPREAFELTFSLTEALGHCALLLILVLAWPAGMREWGLRCVFSLPLLALLVLIDVPAGVLAELWNQVRSDLGAPGLSGWMLLGGSLAGGGAWVLAALLAAAAVLGARLLTRGHELPPGAHA